VLRSERTSLVHRLNSHLGQLRVELTFAIEGKDHLYS